MKVKGLNKAKQALEAVKDAIQEKIDSIEWEGDTTSAQEKDQQRDEYYNAAYEIVDQAIESLGEIDDLKLEDF